VKRQHESLESKIGGSNTDLTVSIPLHEKTINLQTVTQRLLKEIPHPDAITTRLFHIDISHEVSVYVYLTYLVLHAAETIDCKPLNYYIC